MTPTCKKKSHLKALMDFLLSKEGTLGPLSELFTGDSFSISVRKTLL